MSIAHLGLADQREPSESRGHERTPPHDLLAEQSALGGMLLSKDAVADVVEVVRGGDFYIPKHEIVYDAILSLYSHGEPTDVITVTDELTKVGELSRAGGAEYLHTLTSLVPTAANAGYYANIVAEKALLRRLVEAGTRITQMGYKAEGEVLDLVNNAQAEIYSVTGSQETEDYVPLTDAVTVAIDEIEAAKHKDGSMTGVPTGFAELDELTNGLHPGQMIIVAARPALGKSTLALDFARSAAIKHDMATIFFSLEMGRSEIAMRLLSAESSVPLQSMRKGTVDNRDWTTIASTRGRINDAPLYIDDSPNMTLVEIRAKCRRLKQRVGLKMVIIDYLQLMTSGKTRREPSAGGQRVLACPQAAGEGAAGARDRPVAAEPWTGAARRQASRAERPPRVGLDRAGRRHGHPAAPRVRLREGQSARRRGRPDRGQAPKRSDPNRHGRLPGPLLAVHGYGAHLERPLSRSVA